MKKFLAIIMVLALCLSALAVTGFAVESTVTVYAYVPDSWSSAYLYYWQGGAAWPGTAMTKGSDGWYSAKIPASGVEGVIVNNGKGAQTADIKAPELPSGKDFWIVVSSDNSHTVSTTKPGNTNTEAKMRDVYAKVPSDWTKANIYAWNSVGPLASWPGSAMTKGDDGWYHSQIPAAFTSIIINNGSAQTSDLTLNSEQQAADAIWIDLSTLNKVSITTSKPGAAPEQPEEPEVTGAEYYVAGTADLCGVGWDPGASQNKMTLKNGLYTITFKDVPAGTHEFKITDGTWDNSWGDNGGNYILILNAPSEVTITFNADSKAINVTTKATGAVVKVTYHLVGINGDWTASDSNKMTETENGKYAIELELAAGSYGYKVCSSDGKWFPDGMDNETKFTLSAKSVVRFVFNSADGTHTWTVVSGDSEPEDTEPEEKETVTVHAKVPADWTDVAVYAWDANGFAVAWPGSVMTKGEDGWFTAEIPAWAANVIINNNGNGAQTQDIAITMGKDLWIVVEAVEGGFNGTVSYQSPESPKTGDASDLFAVSAVLLLASAGLALTVSKKKEF